MHRSIDCLRATVESAYYKMIVCSILVVFAMSSIGNIILAEDHLVRVRIRGVSDNAARVSITTEDGVYLAPADVVLRKTSRGEEYFYTSGEFSLRLPDAPVRMTISKGLEYPHRTIAISAAADTEVDIFLAPWIDMAALGWYSGDSHIHLQTGGPIVATVADALLAAQAEGVNYSNLCVSNNLGDDIRGREMITGQPHAASSERHLLVFGEEMRSSIYGHMQFFGIRELIEPQYTGFDNTPNHLDFPANFTMAKEACEQSGVVTYGHPMLKNAPEAFGPDVTAANGAARELPIDAVHGVVHAMDIMSYNSDESLSSELWYRLLNCGLKIAASVGTDALLDQSTDPLGGSRVYVNIEGPLAMSSWLDGLKQGRTLVTNGPIPRLSVNGLGPGGTCQLKSGGTVKVQATVDSCVPVDTLEVIVNGQVVKSLALRPTAHAANVDFGHYHFAFDVPIDRSSWIALRVKGPDAPNVFDGPAWGHTGPVTIEVAGQPIRSQADAAYFVEWIEQMLRVVVTRNRYASAEERQQVESLFREAQKYYREMANQE